MGIKTFFVEDSATIRENLIETLQELVDIEPVGFSETETDAVFWLTQPEHKWHLAVVDLFLLQGSGLGVITSCKNRKPYQKIIILSNYVTEDVRQRCKDLKVDAVFDKSKEIDEFIEFLMNYQIVQPD